MKIFTIITITILSISQSFSQTTLNCDKLKAEIGLLKEENNSLKKSLKIGEPIKIVNYENIEFKLLKVSGDIRSQSITFTFNLTTNIANWYINSSVKSIFDIDGNEYKLKSQVLGADKDGYSQIYLFTDVPIKCSYTFGGVLPSVKFIKLFKYDYGHKFGEPFFVEFRDLVVDWK